MNSRLKSFTVGAMALSGLLIGANAASAGVLYAISGAGNAPSSLYTVDTTTGAATLVGATGFSHVNGIDFHPVTGVLYGMSSVGFNQFGPSQLITIDPTTGAGTLVATIATPDQLFNVPDISFDSTGTLHAFVQRDNVTSGGGFDDLYTIDLTSGLPTRVGEAGVEVSRTGLGFDPDDNLFMNGFQTSLNSLFSIDAGTGVATPIGTLLGGQVIRNALEFDETGKLFSVERPSNQGGPSNLLTIDTDTLTMTTVGPMNADSISALASQPPSQVQVSEPVTLALFGLGLAGLGFMRRRRSA